MTGDVTVILEDKREGILVIKKSRFLELQIITKLKIYINKTFNFYS